MEEPKAMNQKSFILTLCWPREEAFPLKIKIPGNPSDELYLGITEACVCKFLISYEGEREREGDEADVKNFDTQINNCLYHMYLYVYCIFVDNHNQIEFNPLYDGKYRDKKGSYYNN
ncbi:hypothetical protein SCA6_016785 [Theobroma cacao]